MSISTAAPRAAARAKQTIPVGYVGFKLMSVFKAGLELPAPAGPNVCSPVSLKLPAPAGPNVCSPGSLKLPAPAGPNVCSPGSLELPAPAGPNV